LYYFAYNVFGLKQWAQVNATVSSTMPKERK